MKNNEEIYSFNDDSDDGAGIGGGLVTKHASSVQLTVDAADLLHRGGPSFRHFWFWCRYYRRNYSKYYFC